MHFGIIRDPNKQDVAYIEASPGQYGFLLGTDELGRDTLSRLICGSRVSLSVGILIQFVILLVGLPIGLIAGYAGGSIDNLLMRLTDIWYAFPDLLFVLVVVSVLASYTSGSVLAAGSVFGGVRLAILSDIHGNLAALEAVIDDLEAQAPDLVVHGGDLSVIGPRPAEIIDVIRERGWAGVWGTQIHQDGRLAILDVANAVG